MLLRIVQCKPAVLHDGGDGAGNRGGGGKKGKKAKLVSKDEATTVIPVLTVVCEVYYHRLLFELIAGVY